VNIYSTAKKIFDTDLLAANATAVDSMGLPTSLIVS
jgi:hypothetical protein